VEGIAAMLFDIFARFPSVSPGNRDYCETRHVRSGEEVNLARVLAAAPNLEELKLNFGCRNHEIQLKYILGTCIWPHLQSLRLLYNYMSDKGP
jgi:hypothetical protein